MLELRPAPHLKKNSETDAEPGIRAAISMVIQKIRERITALHQPSLYKKFNRKRRDFFEFPVYQAPDILTNYRGSDAEFSRIHNCLIEVDFSEMPSFMDLDTAFMCVVVLASDGEKGSLTHLTIPQSDEQRALSITSFVNKLSLYWNKKVPLCLAGGMNAFSIDYCQKLIVALTSTGFIVSAESNDLGGSLYRQATIYPNKVLVERKGYSEILEPITLQFPEVVDR